MISELLVKSSQLRIVIVTVAFGMGIDCPDVHQIIHLGPPDDIESYIQKTGQAGTNGLTAYVTLLKTKGWRRFTDDSMTMYVKNTTLCRRYMLFHEIAIDDFSTGTGVPVLNSLCCDICKIKRTYTNENCFLLVINNYSIIIPVSFCHYLKK